jgi:hypothetical protein
MMICVARREWMSLDRAFENKPKPTPGPTNCRLRKKFNFFPQSFNDFRRLPVRLVTRNHQKQTLLAGTNQLANRGNLASSASVQQLTLPASGDVNDTRLPEVWRQARISVRVVA